MQTGNRIRLAATILFVGLAAHWCPAQANPPTDLKTLNTKYEQGLTGIQTAIDKAIEDWRQAYVAELKKVEQKLQGSGDLDGMLAVRKERERFKKEKKIPESALSDSAALKDLQLKWRKTPEAIALDKSKRISALARSYTAALEDLKKTLTKQGQIDQAIELKSEIERVKTSAPVTAAESILANAAGSSTPDAGKVDKPVVAAGPDTVKSKARAEHSKRGKVAPAAETAPPLLSSDGTIRLKAVPKLTLQAGDGVKHTVDSLTRTIAPSVVVITGKGQIAAGFCIGRGDILITSAFPNAGDRFTVTTFAYAGKELVKQGEIGASRLILTDDDISLLQMDGGKQRLTPLPVAIKNPEPGETVYTAGIPVPSGRIVELPVLEGKVHRYVPGSGDQVWLHQVDQPEAGSSGGPVLNEMGEVVGMNSLQMFGANQRFARPCERIRKLCAP